MLSAAELCAAHIDPGGRGGCRGKHSVPPSIERTPWSTMLAAACAIGVTPSNFGVSSTNGALSPRRVLGLPAALSLKRWRAVFRIEPDGRDRSSFSLMRFTPRSTKRPRRCKPLRAARQRAADAVGVSFERAGQRIARRCRRGRDRR